MGLESIYPVYQAECQELLEAMELCIVELQKNSQDKERLNELFRVAHTIKGSSGVFGFDHVVGITHVLENVLDALRSGTIAFSHELTEILLESRDLIAHLVIDAVEGNEPEKDVLNQSARLKKLLSEFLSADLSAGASEQAGKLPEKASSDRVERIEAGVSDQLIWHVSIRFKANVLASGFNPIAYLSYLNKLGEIHDIYPVFDKNVTLDTMEPESCHLGFEIQFIANPQVSKADIEEVFEFVLDDCVLRIIPPSSEIQLFVDLINSLPEKDERLGEILVEIGAVTQHELERALKTLSRPESGENGVVEASSEGPARLGDVLVAQQAVPKEIVEVAAEKQTTSRKQIQREALTLRVDASKLDSLVNLVGELVISAARSQLLSVNSRNSDLREAVAETARLVDFIRDHALALRMVQIGDTFSRFNRVVYQVSKELGKDVALTISGGETELDKTLVEKINDPLMHLVRNAIDHGIETVEDRIKAGKPAQGNLTLKAFHDSGSIIISVKDDGKGLDSEKLYTKALEKGLIDPEKAMTEAEIFQLIFLPGFSTAAKVSDLSGRGVGMDVVKSSIESIHGSIDLHSEQGKGTSITIRLPLTLAIIDGFLVKIGNNPYIVPLDFVAECIESKAAERAKTGDGYINLRGELLPLVEMARLFDESNTNNKYENIVVVEGSGMRIGLVVNELLGEFQTVIKPMGHLFHNLKGISGSTILGSGEVALIIEPQEIIRCLALRAGKAPAELHAS